MTANFNFDGLVTPSCVLVNALETYLDQADETDELPSKDSYQAVANAAARWGARCAIKELARQWPRPTQEDADSNGFVSWRRKPDLWIWAPWDDDCLAGLQWRHTENWLCAPPTLQEAADNVAWAWDNGCQIQQCLIDDLRRALEREKKPQP
jgi:hypothetical protein